MDLSHLSPDAMQLALVGLLASFRSSVAIVDGEGLLLAVNPTWRDCPNPNPFIQDMEPGSDYLALCQRMLAHPDARLSTVALGIQSALRGKLPSLKLEYQQGSGEALRWYGLQITAPDRSLGVPGVIIHVDITEKMLLQRSMRRIENLFKITTENAADLIAILDSRKGTVFASPSHGWTLGYSTRALERLDYAELVHEDDRPLFSALREEGFARSLNRTLQFRALGKDGSVHRLECRAATVEASTGDFGTLLLVSRDITDRDRL